MFTLTLVLGLMPGMGLTVYAASETTVTYDLSEDGKSINKGGVTCTEEFDSSNNIILGGTFTTSSGTFTRIVVNADDVKRVGRNIEGWSSSDRSSATWTGNSSSVQFGAIMGNRGNVTITFTIETSVDVTGVSLNKNTTTLTVGGTETLTATVSPDDATDKTVKWSVGGTNAEAVKLYTDAACTTEVGTNATSTLTVYAKGMLAGIATITATSNADSTKSASCAVTVNKADPTAPTSLTATYGQTLANVTLPDGWTWVDSTQSVGSVGSNTFKANFAGDSNYNAASNVDVTVTVGKAANPAAVTGTATVTKGGNTVDLERNVTLNGATGDVTYAIAGEANGCTLNGSMLTSGDNTGSVTVNVSVAADNNYNALAATPITVTISDKGTQTITASDVTATYGDTNKKVEATTDGNGAISYAVKDGSADYIDVDASTGALTIKKVGTATVVVTAAETGTYAQATKEVTVTINKASAVAATVTANNSTYDGTDKPLVTVTGEATGGEMQYALGTATEATQPYTTSIPSKTDAGTYYVWYKVVGDDNHSDLEAACVAVTIAEQNRISYTVTFKVVNGSWNDEAADNKTVTLRGVEGEDLKLSEGDIPEVGAKPNDGYEEGSWDVVPSAGTVVTENKIYTYTYAETKSEPTPAPEPTPEPTPTPESGSIEVATSGDAGIEAPAISSEEAKSILEGTGINVSSTDDVKVIVESNTKSEADVQQDADRLKEELKDSDVTIGAYIDILVACIINGGAKNYINKTGSSVILKVPVPSSLVASGRLYIVYRIHGGTVSIVGTSTTPVVPVSSDLFSTYAIGYTTASGEKNSESEIKPCVHTYQWSEDIHPTADTDGETYYKCTKCGHVLYKQTISAYSYFNTECCNRIRNAAANSKVVITTDKWISVHRSVIEELNKRKDVTLEVMFLEEGYKGNRMSFVIPAGSDVMPIIGEDNFVGFIYLGSNFGIKTSY